MKTARDTPCPLCSAPAADLQQACAACPLARGCSVVCCARCGYQFVEESATVRGLLALFGKVRRRAGAPEGRA